MVLLMNGSVLRKGVGANGRRCTEERFDRNNSYQALVDAVIGPTVVKE